MAYQLGMFAPLSFEGTSSERGRVFSLQVKNTRKWIQTYKYLKPGFLVVSPFITWTDLSRYVDVCMRWVSERRFYMTFFFVCVCAMSCLTDRPHFHLILLQWRSRMTWTTNQSYHETVQFRHAAMQVPGARSQHRRCRRNSQWDVHSKLAALAQLLSLVIDPFNSSTNLCYIFQSTLL